MVYSRSIEKLQNRQMTRCELDSEGGVNIFAKIILVHMEPVYINNRLKEWIQREFPKSFEEKYSNWWGRGSNWWSRCLVLKSSLTYKQDQSVQVRYVLQYDHPENDTWPAYIELRILRPSSVAEDDFSDLAAFLMEQFPDDAEYLWITEQPLYVACRNRSQICGWTDVKRLFSQMQERFNPEIQKYFKNEQERSELEKVEVPFHDTDQEVELYTLTLLQLLNLNLKIPDYQRIYCWDEKTIRVLWEDIKNLNKEEKYRLGTIILQKVDDSFQIIDGQQRLVTLSLILATLHIEGISLLEESYQSKLAEDYVAYNKFVIKNILSGVKRSERRITAERLWNGIEFNVLILNDTSIDLAYTFFSNENSKGKSLSDFDLLKAHHLRYMADNPEQSMHLARKWDRMILVGDEADSDSERAYVRSLSLYVFRLRHWIRMRNWDDNVKYNVKREYEAAPLIREIPPFGERFYWNESIQGGSHFFAYVDSILYQFNSFASTNAYKAIHGLDMETHKWYRDVIESLLFCYYLKFGGQYLSEALMLVAKRVSMHRYENFRVNLGKLQQFAADTNIVMMIDRATSPTFFLGELFQVINDMPAMQPQTKIQQRYSQEILRCLEQCKHDVEIKSIIKSFV